MLENRTNVRAVALDSRVAGVHGIAHGGGAGSKSHLRLSNNRCSRDLSNGHGRDGEGREEVGEEHLD